MAAQTILTPGQNYGVTGFPGFPTDVFITGTAAGAEFITIGDFTTAGFSNNFATGTAVDTVRLTGLAANFTIAVSGNQVSLTSTVDGITVTLPVGFGGTTIVFETSPGVFGDTRTLKFFADGGDADTLPDLFLGNQQITPNTPAVGVTPSGNVQNTIILTAGQDVVTAGAADDFFVGFNSTLNAGDNLDGGTGFNTLKVANDGNSTNNAYSGFTTKNIQQFIFTSDDQNPANGGQAVTVDLSGAVGLEKVVSLNSSQDLAFNQLTNIVTVVLDTVTNPATDGPDVTVQFQNAVVAGANDTVNVTVKTSFADVLQIGSVGDANGGVENVAISVVGGTSELDQLDSDITTLTITGDANQAFKIDDALNNTVRTITASALLGTLDIDFSANDAGGQGVNFTGAQGANTVLGGNAGDSITTFAGNDVIQSADDLTTTGNDTINAGEGNNTVVSADGNDSITTGAGNDVINANDGNNTVAGGAGNNNVTTGVGNDVITTLGGADTISSGAGNDSIDSGAGADFITIGAGQHTINAGLGNDTVVAGANFDARTLPVADVQDQIDFGDEAGDADELRINAGLNGGAGSDDFFTNIVDGTLEQLTITTSGTTDLTGGVNGVNDAQDSGIEIVNLDFGGPNTDNFISTSFTRGLIVNVGKQGDASYAFGGNDTLVLGSGSDTVNAAGDNNLTNGDRFNGGTNTTGSGDVLNLDGDTTIDNTALGVGQSVFAAFEIVNLDTGVDNDYSLTLNDLNAPTSGALTVNGGGLLAGETVFLTTAAVTAGGFNVSVTSGAGNDVLVSGVKNDTLISGAGSDSINISLGGSDFVRSGGAADADNDVINAGGALDGTDTIFGGADAAGSQTTDPFAATFTNGDTLIVTGINAAPAFVNVKEVETVRLEGASGSVTLDGTTTTDIKQVILADAGSSTVNAAAYGGALIVDANAGASAGKVDNIVTTALNDIVFTGAGAQTLTLGVGNDTVVADGNEFNTDHTVAGGAGTDTVILDNRNNGVEVRANLNIVTDVERYVVFKSGDTGIGNNADANLIEFSQTVPEAVGTLTAIEIDNSALTDTLDSTRVRLDETLDDRDFQFTILGSGTAGVRTIVEKDNIGTTNNIIFNAQGAGQDELVIDGEDAGSTVTMNGGGGQDRIIQSQDGTRSMFSDDGFVNITNVNILTGEDAGDLNATLGQRAGLTNINQIIDTAGDDDVLLNAAFVNASNSLSVSVSGGNDSINAAATTTTVSFVATGSVASTITADDSLTGGSLLADTLTLRNNETANISGVDQVETIQFTNNGLVNQTATVTTDGSNVLSAGQALLNVNAGTLTDAGDSLVFTATGGALGYSITGAAGNDSIVTQGAADIINTGTGNDTVNAGNGNNVIDTGAGNDSVITGSGNDSITLGSGNDTVFAAGAGNDTVIAGDGDDQIRTDAGADSIVAGLGADQIFGGAGGDTIVLGGSDGARDTAFYVALGDSSTSSARDTITGFASGEDVIDVRYVAELLTNVYASDPDGAGPINIGDKVYTAGVSQLQFLGNFSEFGGAQGALSNAQAGNVGIVFQQNTNTLWIDLNDDSVLNGDDLQIVLDGISTVTAADVLSGSLVGQTNVPSGGTVIGSIIDERFVLIGAGPWTVDGGLGSDTIVAANGQDISTVRPGPSAGANFTNVEFLEIAAGGTVTTNVAQYNVFQSQEAAGTGGFVNKGAGQTLNFSDSGTIVGTNGQGVDTYNLANGNDDFELNFAGTNVSLGLGNNTFRTQPAGAGKDGPSDLDLITGTITLTGNDTWVADHNDNISGATIIGSFDQTLLTESTITVNASQHGTTGNNGSLGTIVDAGDDTNGGNSPDTIIITTAAAITGHADIENYVLNGGNDVFTVNAAKLGVNLTSATGTDTVKLTGTVPTGNYVVQAVFQEYAQGVYNFGGDNDTLQIVGTADIRGINGGNDTTLDQLDLATNAGANTVSLTEAQHDAFGAVGVSGDGITGAGQDDTVNLFSVEPFNDPSFNSGDDGVVEGSTTIGTYNLDGSFDFKVGAAFQAVNSTNGTQTIRVDGLVMTADITDDTGGDADNLVLSNGGDISGINVTNVENLRIATSGRLTSSQYAGFGEANVTGTSNADTINVVNDGVTTTITGDTDIETFNLEGDLTFNVVGLTTDVAGRSTQDVNGDAGDQTVVITKLDYRGDIALGAQGATDTLSLVGDAVGGAGTADISQAGSITGVEATLVTGQTKMTLAQHNGSVGAISGSGGVDQITVVGAGTLTGQTGVENYVLSNTGANTFNVTADTRSVIVAASGALIGFNDTVNLDGATFTTAPFVLALDANAGGAGDLLTTTGNIDISNINSGAETTAETLRIVTDGVTTAMTVAQHEGFTAEIDANGTNDTVALTDAGTIFAEIEIEAYNLGAAVNTVNVNPLNASVAVFDLSATGDSDTVVLDGRSNAITVVNAAGSYNLTNTADVLRVAGTVNIAGLNGGAATTTEQLVLFGATNALTLSQVQHEDFALSNQVTATAGADTLTIIGAGAVTAFDNVENYVLSNAANTITINSAEANVNITSVGGTSDTVAVGGFAVGGTWNLDGAADVLTLANSADISGVNAGAATTIETVQVANNASVTMTVAQHEGFKADVPGTAGFQAAGVNTVTLSNDGTINARNQVEGYVLNGDGVGGSTLNWNVANVPDVDGLPTSVTGAGGADTIAIIGSGAALGLTLALNGTWALAGSGSVATNDALTSNIELNFTALNSGGSTTIENFTLSSLLDADDDATLTAAQHDFLTVTAASTTNTFTITTDGTYTAYAAIETYNLSSDGGAGSTITVNSGNTAVDINGTSGADTINVAGLTVTGDYALAGADDTLVATTGADISGVNSGAATTAETLDLTGAITMTDAQYDAFFAGTITAAGTTDSVTISDTASITAHASIETYNLTSAGADSITVNLSDTDRAELTVNVTGAGSDVIALTNQSFTAGGSDDLVVTGFVAGAAGDQVDLTGYNGNFLNNLSLGLGANSLGAGGTTPTATGSLLEFVQGSPLTLTATGNAGEVETFIADAVSDIDAGNYFAVLYDGSGNAGLYEINVSTTTSDLTVAQLSVELISTFGGVGGSGFVTQNFV